MTWDRWDYQVDPEVVTVVTRAEIMAQLRAWINDWAIDPHDAGLILDQVGEGVDRETFGDYLDGAGYPELAEKAYVAS